MAKIKQIQTHQQEQLDDTRTEIQEQIERKNGELRTHIDRTLSTHLTATENKIISNHETIISHTTEQLQKHKENLEYKIQQTEVTNKAQTEEIVQERMQAFNKIIQPQITEQAKTLEDNKFQIQTINQTIQQHRDELETLKLNPNNKYVPGNGTIHVVCNAAENLYAERQLPKFNGRGINPNETLTKIKRFYDRNLLRQPNSDPREILIDILETSFEGHAARWLQLIKHDILNWESFADEFTRKFWSRELQRGIKTRMESERYRNNGTLSRAEYFTDRVLLLQSITPSLSEEEIVSFLSERFDQIIQDSRTVQNITTIKEFESLLQREDIREHQARSNHQHNSMRRDNERPTPRSRAQDENRPNSPPPDRIEHRAYQPPNPQGNYRTQNYNNRQNWNPNYHNNRYNNRYDGNRYNNQQHNNRSYNSQRFPQDARIQDQAACAIMRGSNNSSNSSHSSDSGIKSRSENNNRSENQ